MKEITIIKGDGSNVVIRFSDTQDAVVEDLLPVKLQEMLERVMQPLTACDNSRIKAGYSTEFSYVKTGLDIIVDLSNSNLDEVMAEANDRFNLETEGDPAIKNIKENFIPNLRRLHEICFSPSILAKSSLFRDLNNALVRLGDILKINESGAVENAAAEEVNIALSSLIIEKIKTSAALKIACSNLKTSFSQKEGVIAGSAETMLLLQRQLEETRLALITSEERARSLEQENRKLREEAGHDLGLSGVAVHFGGAAEGDARPDSDAVTSASSRRLSDPVKATQSLT